VAVDVTHLEVLEVAAEGAVMDGHGAPLCSRDEPAYAAHAAHLFAAGTM
jgi:hypothetical protein